MLKRVMLRESLGFKGLVTSQRYFNTVSSEDILNFTVAPFSFLVLYACETLFLA
jgi:hypothetical protein